MTKDRFFMNTGLILLTGKLLIQLTIEIDRLQYCILTYSMF